MERFYYDFEEKTLLGNVDSKMFFSSRKHTVNLLHKSMKTLSAMCFLLEHELKHNNSRTVTGFDCRIKVPNYYLINDIMLLLFQNTVHRN